MTIPPPPGQGPPGGAPSPGGFDPGAAADQPAGAGSEGEPYHQPYPGQYPPAPPAAQSPYPQPPYPQPQYPQPQYVQSQYPQSQYPQPPYLRQSGDGAQPVGPAAAEFCAFHPDRQTALHCTRCGRPACPECLTPASVGFHCRACVAEGRANVPVQRTIAGARVGVTPIVTYVLIGLNVLIFLITAIQARSGVDPSQSRIFQNGTLAPTLVASGQWWRLLSSGFLHLSVIHIGVNMLSLYFVGVALERILGRSRFLVVYLLSLLGGSACVMLFTDPLASAVGASGAIFGLLGGLLVVFKRYRYDMRQLLFILALNLYVSFQFSGISWQAHVGGLVIGAAATAAMVYSPRAVQQRVQIGAVVGILVLVVAVVLIRDSQIAVHCTDLDAVSFSGCSTS